MLNFSHAKLAMCVSYLGFVIRHSLGILGISAYLLLLPADVPLYFLLMFFIVFNLSLANLSMRYK